MKTVREFTYLGVKVSTGGECVASVTVNTRCGWVRFREFGVLVYGWRFPLRMNVAVYKSFVGPAMLYESEA